MLEPILAEDSTITKLVPSLEGILNDLNESATHYDYFVALLIVSLAESGFHVSSTDTRPKCQSLRSLRIPKDWKSQETGVYDMTFQLDTFPDVKCKLIAIPSGDTLIVNFFPLMDERRTYSMAAQVLKYVNPFSSDRSGLYRNLKMICHRFKDELATPVRSDVLNKAGLMCPSLQGLPTELKLKILGMLDVHDLIHIGQCSYEFFMLCSKMVNAKTFPSRGSRSSKGDAEINLIGNTNNTDRVVVT